MPDLIAQLRRAPHEFNLFQAISLLERSEPSRAPVGTGQGIDEAVRLAGQTDFAFPASDIASLGDSARPGPPLMLRTAALTLAGGHGPIATPFTEMLLEQRRQRDYAGLDFLDIFNQRLIGFWYRSRCKRHLALRPHARESAPLVRALDALSGLGRGEGARGPDGEQAWLRHAALQSAAPRSMATLLALLRDRIGVAFAGRQMVGRWHALAPRDHARLGKQQLGMGASLGARAWDQSAAMALTTAPLAPAQFAALLPSGDQYGLLGWLVARHLQQDISVSLQPALAVQPASRLGGAQALAPRLGQSAWLCSGAGSAQAYQQPRFDLRAQPPLTGADGHAN
ncbi:MULTISPECIES: type VI secretion system baseplate subunit TssG [unclassified Janthinobacterium]|uniref:type VI secretion system baseplate subunit TssG n=1 Tax=unclassified Janthinobacterium TaxID=2610881 RepID=UPI00034B9A66|nr:MULTISPECIES: type VI secretion system baseplate subunit TssG [unclassified Janthinobacterium]MEC5162581.1 type VI secretion system protein ImpH [Janthinobacterium sp. CG_S6]